jgi:hypothetical protein
LCFKETRGLAGHSGALFHSHWEPGHVDGSRRFKEFLEGEPESAIRGESSRFMLKPCFDPSVQYFFKASTLFGLEESYEAQGMMVLALPVF